MRGAEGGDYSKRTERPQHFATAGLEVGCAASISQQSFLELGREWQQYTNSVICGTLMCHV